MTPKRDKKDAPKSAKRPKITKSAGSPVNDLASPRTHAVDVRGGAVKDSHDRYA